MQNPDTIEKQTQTTKVTGLLQRLWDVRMRADLWVFTSRKWSYKCGNSFYSEHGQGLVTQVLQVRYQSLGFDRYEDVYMVISNEPELQWITACGLYCSKTSLTFFSLFYSIEGSSLIWTPELRRIQGKSLGTIGQVTLFCTSRKARHRHAPSSNWRCPSSISEDDNSVYLP